MMSVGILNLTRFGDLLQTTPVLAGLRRRFPEARIHLIVKRRFESVAALLPGADEIRAIDGDEIARLLADPAVPFLDAFRTVRALLAPLREIHFDQLLNFTHSRASAVLLSLLQAAEPIGFTLDREGQRRVRSPWLLHMGTLVRARRTTRFNLVDLYLGAAGLAGCGERLGFRVPDSARSFARARLAGGGPTLAVQLGASQDAKTWGLEHFAATLRALALALPDLRVALVGVPAERERARALAATTSGVALLDLVGETSIAELAAVLERADLLFTCDTGTMHLAGAVGARTCSVFVGLGIPHETAVYGEGHWALRSRIACAPCDHHVHCGFTACHGDLPPGFVAECLRRLLRGEDPASLPPLPRAELLRTVFDEDGLLDLEPAWVRAAEPEDLLALAYRAAFLSGFTGRPPALEAVRARARSRYGVEPGGWAAHLPGELAPRLAELEAVDTRVFAIARAQPLLAPLGLALEGELENLPDGRLREIAETSAGHYDALRSRAALVRELVAGGDA